MSNNHKEKVVNLQKRLFGWVKSHVSIIRLGLTALSLLIILVLIPSHIRVYFWQGLIKQKILAVMLVSFSILAISLILSAGQRLDSWFFLLLNIRGHRPTWLDKLMVGFTNLGHAFATLGFALVLLLSGKQIFSYKLILGSITLLLLVEFLKLIIFRSRPFVRLTQTRIVGGKAIGRSFPSGHTSQIFFTAVIFIQGFHLPLIAALGLYAIALLVGVTRIYVGAHYPRDIMAGAILGSAWGIFWGMIDRFFFISLT
jgi:membrane-associated phospholipid phosphatase